MRPRAATALALLAGYLFCRAALGATLNPLHNGPDEGGHVEYVQTLAEGRRPTGVEARQLPTYYALAALPWRMTEGRTPFGRSFTLRLLSAASGVLTLWATWRAARLLWPTEQEAAARSALWLLAPGHLFLLASVTNDPLAFAVASLSFLAALRAWLEPGDRSRWVVWALAGAAALAVKPTAITVVAGAAGAFAWRWRLSLFASTTARRVLLGVVLCGAAVNALLALQPPTLSAAHSLARYWPLMLARAPLAYVQRGGVLETFRTWWHAYDYLVRWPPSVDVALSLAGIVAIAMVAVGLALSRGRAVPGLVWGCAAAQVAFVLGRYGFADVLQISMGGAAQAKAFLPGIAPLALLGAAGLGEITRRLRLNPRLSTLGLLGTLVVVDAISLAVTTWSHYRWWQVGA